MVHLYHQKPLCKPSVQCAWLHNYTEALWSRKFHSFSASIRERVSSDIKVSSPVTFLLQSIKVCKAEKKRPFFGQGFEKAQAPPNVTHLMEESSLTFWSGTAVPVGVDILWLCMAKVNFFSWSGRCMQKLLKKVFTFKFYPLHAKISTTTRTPVPD